MLAPGRGLDHLAPDPGRGRVGGHLEVEQAAAMVADQEEDVEGLEGQSLDYEEVGCPDDVGVVGEEGTPALAGRLGWPAASVASDGASAHCDAELEQLAADPLGTPVRVFARHGGDQLAGLGVQPRTSPDGAGAPAPEQTPAPALPAQHGLRPDQEQVASPVLVQAPDEEPEELVPSSEAWPTLGTEGNLELLAEKQVLHDEAPTAAGSGDEGGQDEPHEFKHRGRIADPMSPRSPYDLLPSYNPFIESAFSRE